MPPPVAEVHYRRRASMPLNQWRKCDINPNLLWSNVTGSATFTGPASATSWIDAWEQAWQQSPGRCFFLGCGNDATSGLHIFNRQRANTIFIVPGCASCNSTSYDDEKMFRGLRRLSPPLVCTCTLFAAGLCQAGVRIVMIGAQCIQIVQDLYSRS